MNIDLKYRPSGTAAHLTLSAGEKITAESGAMMAMTPGILITTSTHSRGKGGALAGLKRLVSGESFFLNHFEAVSTSELWLSTSLPGDMLVHELKGENLIVAGGAYVGSGAGVQIDLQFQGMKGLFTGQNLFWLKANGQGPLILGSFGEIYPVEVNGEYIVDTGHIVAFQETLSFSISKMGSSWLNSILGGEGFVCRFKGQGIIWCQSHSAPGFGRELTPFLKHRS